MRFQVLGEWLQFFDSPRTEYHHIDNLIFEDADDTHIKIIDKFSGREIVNSTSENLFTINEDGIRLEFPNKAAVLNVLDNGLNRTGESVVAANYISQFARERGNPSNINANNDYSITPAVFEFGPPLGEDWVISAMLLSIAATGKVDGGGYGSGLALVNGVDMDSINLLTTPLGTRRSLLDGFPITGNRGWGLRGHEFFVTTIGTGGAADEFLNMRWNFDVAGRQLRMSGSQGTKIELTVNDDFTSRVNDQFFLFQGYKV